MVEKARSKSKTSNAVFNDSISEEDSAPCKIELPDELVEKLLLGDGRTQQSLKEKIVRLTNQPELGAGWLRKIISGKEKGRIGDRERKDIALLTIALLLSSETTSKKSLSVAFGVTTKTLNTYIQGVFKAIDISNSSEEKNPLQQEVVEMLMSGDGRRQRSSKLKLISLINQPEQGAGHLRKYLTGKDKGLFDQSEKHLIAFFSIALVLSKETNKESLSNAFGITTKTLNKSIRGFVNTIRNEKEKSSSPMKEKPPVQEEHVLPARNLSRPPLASILSPPPSKKQARLETSLFTPPPKQMQSPPMKKQNFRQTPAQFKYSNSSKNEHGLCGLQMELDLEHDELFETQEKYQEPSNTLEHDLEPKQLEQNNMLQEPRSKEIDQFTDYTRELDLETEYFDQEIQQLEPSKEMRQLVLDTFLDEIKRKKFSPELQTLVFKAISVASGGKQFFELSHEGGSQKFLRIPSSRVREDSKQSHLQKRRRKKLLSALICEFNLSQQDEIGLVSALAAERECVLITTTKRLTIGEVFAMMNHIGTTSRGIARLQQYFHSMLPALSTAIFP
jgi:hypothetical protein